MGMFGDIFGGVMSFIGGERANRANEKINDQNNAFNAEQADLNRIFSADQAAKQMQFQERMANTSYQRAIGDMKAAGLNPMLAYSQGGANTPSGAMGAGSAAQAQAAPTMRDTLTPAISTALRQSEVTAALKLNEERVENAKAENRLLNAQAVETDTRAQKNLTDIGESPSRIRLNMASAAQADRNAERLIEEIPRIRQQVHLYERQAKTEEERARLTRAQSILTEITQEWKKGEINLQGLESMMRDVEIQIGFDSLNRSENEREKAKTWWGRNVSPFLNDIRGTTSSARDAVRTYRGR
ncbi:DNA pilot protein [Apis mellifera associated microvirus 14]|nr:DNA pilot protein [Apis mellifera associated microvirus 14]